MKSSTGEHFVALDHIRAFAALQVVVWHFSHGAIGYPVPFDQPIGFFPAALLDEGHTGVALFMTLSGFLFAKLLDGREIRFPAFLYNRVLRLLPLLVVVLVLAGVVAHGRGVGPGEYALSLLEGTVLPTLPNGAWSITVEFHYYLILPAFLWMLRRSRWLPLAVLGAAIALRLGYYLLAGDVQTLAYSTLLGRIDQFTLGMLAFHFRSAFVGRHLRVGAILVAFAAFYWFFDAQGGYYRQPGAAWLKPIWVILPTIEGLAYAAAIAWYDGSFSLPNTRFSALVGRIGTYSYSIYLLHFFVVFHAAGFVHGRVMDLSNFYVAAFWALLFYLAMVPVGYLSFRFIEAPFLKLRKRYLVPRNAATLDPAGQRSTVESALVHGEPAGTLETPAPRPAPMVR